MASYFSSTQKSKPGVPLAETKRLLLDYHIDHIWSKLKSAKYFSILYINSGYHISIHPDSRLKKNIYMSIGNIPVKRVAFGVQTAPSIFLSLMFKLVFKYLDEFLVFWKHDLLIYNQNEEHLKHLELVFERFREACKKLKMSKCTFFKKGIEYIGHLVSGQGICPMKQKIKAITNLA